MKETPAYQSRFEPWRFWVLYGIIGLLFGFYAIKLFSVQIINGEEYRVRAEENRTTDVSISTQRGIIYDRNGTVLARNVASYNVIITPAYLPTDLGSQQEIFRRLAVLIDVPVSNGTVTEETVRTFTACQTDWGITEIVFLQDSLAQYKPVRVKCGIDEKTAMIIREKKTDWPGVEIEIAPIRDYPTGQLTSEVIGFLGPIGAIQEEKYRDLGFVPGRDKIGFAGIESYMNDELMGKPGKRVVEVDVAGKVMRDLQPPVPAVPGQNLYLTIDTRLQAASKAALEWELNYWNAWLGKILSLNGVVIAMNPKTGEILSMVSFPTYENNRMARFIPAYYYNQLYEDPYRPLFNHAISAEHPPGSVFKLPTAVGILNEKVVTPDKLIEDPGEITITEKFYENDPGRERRYVCYKRDGHGQVNFLEGVALSCDVYFYKVGGGYKDEVKNGGLGINRIKDYAEAFGYGKITGIELPGETDGLIPDPTWKRLTIGENWSTGDTYIATIGQGFVLATPLQVLVSAATIANDGKMMKPTLIKEIRDSDGNVIKPFIPILVHDVTKDPTINIYDENGIPTGDKKTIEPWTIELTQEGMRRAVTDGTAVIQFRGFDIPSAGKTGTAEYCDNVAQANKLCSFGNWPAHAWYVGYAPYDDPEIVVLAFVYNGREGSTVAGPIVRKVMEAYFCLKKIDSGSECNQ
ncbi:MAG: penicillin-binding protein 2 [Anaerolineaceae bacterium]|nr:penicillin-binding protein 2 [Anaerolineaceae bacterium]